MFSQQFTLIYQLLLQAVQHVAEQQVCFAKQGVRAKLCYDVDNTSANPPPLANKAKRWWVHTVQTDRSQISFSITVIVINQKQKKKNIWQLSKHE